MYLYSQHTCTYIPTYIHPSHNTAIQHQHQHPIITINRAPSSSYFSSSELYNDIIVHHSITVPDQTYRTCTRSQQKYAQHTTSDPYTRRRARRAASRITATQQPTLQSSYQASSSCSSSSELLLQHHARSKQHVSDTPCPSEACT